MAPRIREKFFGAIALLLFGCYWTFALLAVSPPNYLTPQYGKYVSAYRYMFSQAWYFFSPAPKANLRIYYTFTKTVDGRQTSYVVELFEDIHRHEFEGIRLNLSKQLEDDFVYTAVDSIDRYVLSARHRKAIAQSTPEKENRNPATSSEEATPVIVGQQNGMNPDSSGDNQEPAHKGSSDSIGDLATFGTSLKMDPITAPIAPPLDISGDIAKINIANCKIKGVEMLVKYAKEVAIQNHLNPDEYQVKFTGAYVLIPVFAHRSDLLKPKDQQSKEVGVFESNYFPLKGQS